MAQSQAERRTAYPFLLLSMIRGRYWCRYVDVHMKRRITSRSDSKWKRADWEGC